MKKKKRKEKEKEKRGRFSKSRLEAYKGMMDTSTPDSQQLD